MSASGEVQGVPLMPENPSRSRIEQSLLEQYFDSIKEPFRDTQIGQANGSPMGPFIALFIFCFIPLVPYLISKLVLWLAGHKHISFHRVQIDVSSFWAWWILTFALSLLLLILVGKFSGPTTQDKKNWLSLAQMRFAYSYGVVHEIKNFRTNRMSRHIDKALEFLDKVAEQIYAIPSFSRRGDIYPYTDLGRHYPAILATSDDYPKWFRLRPETETILQAFRELMPKLRDRVKDQKDLAAVEAVLTDLAAYQYSEIPQVSESNAETKFEEGVDILLQFADRVISLPPYRSEALKPTSKEKVSGKAALILRKITGLFVHENVLISFFSWLVLTLLLFWGGFGLVLRIVSLKLDSTLIVALIGGPIAAAVTGATVPRLGKSKTTKQ